MKTQFPLWLFAVIGLGLVLFLAAYVSFKFQETGAVQDEAETGLYIENPPKPAIVASSLEQKRMLSWIKKNGLNDFGDPVDTIYGPGEPLSKDGKKIYVNKFHYMIEKHPDRPWNTEQTAVEKQLIDAWIKANNLNQFGDAKDTIYIGGTPLFDETTGKSIDLYDYIRQKHPDKPWTNASTEGAQ